MYKQAKNFFFFLLLFNKIVYLSLLKICTLVKHSNIQSHTHKIIMHNKKQKEILETFS